MDQKTFHYNTCRAYVAIARSLRTRLLIDFDEYYVERIRYYIRLARHQYNLGELS